jgi:hypothetical protein
MDLLAVLDLGALLVPNSPAVNLEWPYLGAVTGVGQEEDSSFLDRVVAAAANGELLLFLLAVALGSDTS